MTSREHTRGLVRGRALSEDHASHPKRIKFSPEALTTREVKYLVASFLLKPEDLLDARVFHPDAWHGANPNARDLNKLLERAPLAACTRLFEEFDRTHTDSVAHWKGRRGFDIALDTPKALLITYFQGACAFGQCHILQDLKAQKRLTAQDARDENNLALRWAALNGHVAVLVELRNNWGFTAEDARAEFNLALRWAVANGHVAVLEELRNNWGLTADDARTGDNYALMLAVAYGHVAVLVELRTNWGFTARDARAQNNCALEWAAESGHVAVLVELRTNWAVTIEEVRAAGYYVLRRAAANEHVPVLVEFRDHWAITIEEVRALNLSGQQLCAVRLVWPDV